MPVEPLLNNDLLDPISADQPAGVDLRWTPEWDRIKEARRADDTFESGKWAKKEQKISDWPLVQKLVNVALRERSKDLQLAVWLMEANIKLNGFAGLRDSLWLLRELMVRYWDNGLYPTIEDGPEDRAGPFEWMNDKLMDSVAGISITARSDAGDDYSFTGLQDARHTGSESSYKSTDGEIDTKKKKEFEAALEKGHISMEMFERAIRETRRASYEELHLLFQQCHTEFKELEKVIDARFGDGVVNLPNCRATFREIGDAMAAYLEKKRKDEPATPSSTPADSSAAPSSSPGAPEPIVMRIPLPLPATQGFGGLSDGSWQDAELLIRSGQIDQGLAQMTRLAASETSGRSRFQRRLLLAEVCLASSRDRLARLILEELAEQIDKFQLESWETTELVCSVWSRLYELYKQGESDSDRAEKLYERLCKLDPWQALRCTGS